VCECTKRQIKELSNKNRKRQTIEPLSANVANKRFNRTQEKVGHGGPELQITLPLSQFCHYDVTQLILTV